MVFPRMLVRVPVHGMQALFELQRTRKYILLIFPCTALPKKHDHDQAES
jgi:hypothetical protein